MRCFFNSLKAVLSNAYAQLSDGKSVVLEEYARSMIYEEEVHLDEVNKILRYPGELKSFDSEEGFRMYESSYLK